MATDSRSPAVMHAPRTVGSLVAACLAQQGVRTVFGIPGTHNLEIYRGLQQEGIDHILVRHEQGGTYAATGFAWASGRPGVVIATTGPGVTNCITGLANAQADSIPLLVISPGAPRHQERRELGFLHEAKDQRAGLANFVQHSFRAETPEAVVEAVQQVFHSYRTARPRAAHIEIPFDLLLESTCAEAPTPWPSVMPFPAMADLEAAAELIAGARRPLIVAGGGATGASRELTALVESCGLPIVTTVHGKGVVDENHQLSAGALAGGHGGFDPVAKADVILAVGTELKNAEVNAESAIVRIDIDQEQLNRHHSSTVPLLGDAGAVVGALGALLSGREVRDFAAWSEQVFAAAKAGRASASKTWRLLHQAVLQGSSAAGYDRPLLTGDSSQVSWIGTVQSALLAGPRQFVTTDGYATLGFSLPAALGAKIADPLSGVVALLGDGALMFTIQELATAAELELGFPVVVVDNGGYAEIRENMIDAGIAPMAVDLKAPNYSQLAAGFGVLATSASTPEELKVAVTEAHLRKVPTIIRVQQEDLDKSNWRSHEAAGEVQK